MGAAQIARQRALHPPRDQEVPDEIVHHRGADAGPRVLLGHRGGLHGHRADRPFQVARSGLDVGERRFQIFIVSLDDRLVVFRAQISEVFLVVPYRKCLVLEILVALILGELHLLQRKDFLLGVPRDTTRCRVKFYLGRHGDGGRRVVVSRR